MEQGDYDRQAQAAYERAAQAAGAWRRLSVLQRVAALQRVHQQVAARSEEFARGLSSEMGKPISAARIEVQRALEEWQYLQDHAPAFLEPEPFEGGEVQFAPLGVVAVISPWNFPVLLPLRAIVPALLAGNGAVFKPSELTLTTGALIGSVFGDDLPVCTVAGGKELGAAVVRTPVAAVAFTGSTAVGKAIARESATTLKRLVLELGGLDAAIVLADADLETTAHEVVRANVRNAGQVCNAVKRVFVHQRVHDQFVQHLTAASRRVVYGNPADERTEVGPIVSQAQWERVRGFLDDAVQCGAQVVQVAGELSAPFFPQTILTQVPCSARLLSEEPFGPLLPVVSFTEEDEVVRRANETRFGLTASVWTHDGAAFRRIAAQLEVGMVRHNTHSALGPGIPWGGCKESGVGRMKTKEGLREFTNVRVVA
jgi:acyl-CoA reductase-like NAD-dependent aldehyde dehydrogenase